MRTAVVPRSYAVVTALLLMLGTAVSGWAQNNAVITGRATDTSGALIPGVTATLTSPQLIGTRTQVTDETGGYRFTLLGPGVYRLEFELPGFRTLVREGVQMTTGFTATINVTLEVATVADRITVTGETPLVDLEQSKVGTTFTPEILSNLPTSNQYYEVLSVARGLQLNVPDVGGSRANQQQTVRSYGTSGQFMIVTDGITTTQQSSIMSMYYDPNSMAEMEVVELGKSAEVKTSGLAVNMVVKSGGNALHGSYKIDYINSHFQGSNLSDALRARNIEANNKIQLFRDTYFDIGGPFKKDKFWWYVSGKQMDMRKNLYGFYKSDDVWLTCDRHGQCNSQPAQGTKVPALFSTTNRNLTGKFTYALNSKHTLSYTGLLFDKWDPERGTDTTGVFRTDNDTAILYKPIWAQKIQLNSVLGQRTTLETRVAKHMDGPRHEYPKSQAISRFDLDTQEQRGAYCCTGVHQVNIYDRAQIDVILGHHATIAGRSHNLKAGYTWQWERGLLHFSPYSNHVSTEWRGGFKTPAFIYTYDTPFSTDDRLKQHNFFFNDAWNVSRKLTVNLGVRYDRRLPYTPEQGKLGIGPYQEKLTVPAKKFQTFHNPVARLSLVYDPFGKGKTAIKLSYAGYSWEPHVDITTSVNPTGLIRKRYTWDGYLPPGFPAEPYVPDPSKLVSVTGGTNNQVDPKLKMGRTDEFTASVNHEIARDMVVDLLVVRKRTMDIQQTVNVAQPYEAFNIPVTFTDPGRPGFPSSQITVYGLDRAYIGSVQNLQTNNPTRIDNILGYSFGLTKRYSRGWLSNAGLDILNYKTGDNATNPNAALNAGSRYWSWQFKALGRYDFPGQLGLSATLRSRKGEPKARTIRTPSLTQGIITVNAEPLGSTFYSSYSLLDIQLQKTFSIRERAKVITEVTLANALNNSAALSASNLTGATYDQVNAIIDPRVFRIGLGIRF